MRIIIVEDELHNSRLLRGMVNHFKPEWQIIDAFETVKSTVHWLQNNEAPDLIFMDIQLADAICFSIFEQVEVTSPVIFTTAYDEYAIQAFKVNSIDYLLKPIKEEKLQVAIEKFDKLVLNQQKPKEKIAYHEILEAIKQGEKKYRKRFVIAGATAFTKLDVSDIAYFFTENRITYAFTFEGQKHILDITMEKLEDQLDPEIFYRANRSHILHCDSIKKFENYFGGKLVIRLIPPLNEQVIISRLKAAEFKEWLDK